MNGDETAPTMDATEWTLLLILSVLWGGSFFFYKVLVAAVPPVTVVLGRVGLAAIVLNLLLVARREPLPRDPRLWAAFAVMGTLNNVVPFTLFAFGETRISSGLASILNATTPVFGVLVAHLLTSNEKLNWAKAAGILFGFLGVVALIGPGMLAGLDRGDRLGEAACLGAALSYAFAGIFGRRFRGVAPLTVATGQVTASTLVLIPLSVALDAPWTLPMPGLHVWLAFAGIALFSTALAYILYFRILAAAGATNLLLVTFLLPISALALGAAFLGEVVTGRTLAGMTLIGLALAAIDGRLSKWLYRTSRRRSAETARDDYVI